MSKIKDTVIIGDLMIDYDRYSLKWLSTYYSLYDNVANENVIDNVTDDPEFMDHEDNIPGRLAYMLTLLMNEDNGIYLFEIGAYLESPPLYYVGLAEFASGIQMLTVPDYN